jgi:hypothetical protein
LHGVDGEKVVLGFVVQAGMGRMQEGGVFLPRSGRAKPEAKDEGAGRNLRGFPGIPIKAPPSSSA